MFKYEAADAEKTYSHSLKTKQYIIRQSYNIIVNITEQLYGRLSYKVFIFSECNAELCKNIKCKFKQCSVWHEVIMTVQSDGQVG